MRLARLGFVPVLGLLPLLGFGCSDPAPPTPRGAYYVNFADPGAGCNIAGHLLTLGDVSEIAKTTVVTDGEGDASVECSVTGSGTFNVSAAGDRLGEGIRVQINGIAPSATAETPATGSVTFWSGRTANNTFVSDPADPCRFWFLPETKQGVSAGSIWTVFECPTIVNGSDSCEIKRGILAFDSCGT